MMERFRYLFSFETKGAAKLPLDSETHNPEEKYETAFGGATPMLIRWWNKLSSGNAHAKPLYYWAIAIVLGAITLVEIFVLDFGFTPAMLVFVVLVLGAMKFVLVVALYMHLRFDHKMYTWVFVACMVLGVLVFVAFMALMASFGALQR